MSKKKHEEEHRSAEAGGLRWLLTYADLVTLLLASFVVLFATREAPSPKTIQIIIEAAKKTFRVVGGGPYGQGEKPFQGGRGVLPNEETIRREIKQETPQTPDPHKAAEEELESMAASMGKEVTSMGKYACPQGMKCVELPSGMQVSIPGDLLFDSGSSGLRASALEKLDGLGKYISASSGEVRFEGHTDSDPISSAVFPSNWELSAARAAAVARHFTSKWAFPSRRVVIVGHGEFKPRNCNWNTSPKECNKNPQQKQVNRRVTVTVHSGDVSKAGAGATTGGVLP